MGIEPTSSAWEADVLPLNYIRNSCNIIAFLNEGINMTQRYSRRIQSFVKRQGRITKRQAQALEKYSQRYLLDSSSQLDNGYYIANPKGKRVVEIGCGMGEALLTQAQKHPENDFIGIEVYKPGIGSIMASLHEKGLTNVALYQADAVDVFENCLPDGFCDIVQIFFPDPWPKKRHHKRRLIQPDFVELLIQKLKDGGAMQLATDWPDYAEHMLNVLEGFDYLINQAGNHQFCERPHCRPLTKFEKRGQSKGHPVYDLEFKVKK